MKNGRLARSIGYHRLVSTSKRFPWPTALTLCRLVLIPVFLGLLLIHWRMSALVILSVMAVTDVLDGYLARRLNQITRLGIILDPIADKLLITGCFLVLIFPQHAPAGFAIPWPIFWGVCQKDICVLIGALVVKRKVGNVAINANRLGKLNTVFEIALVLSTLLAPELIAISPAFAAMHLWLLWHLTVLATAAAAMGYSIDGAKQLRTQIIALTTSQTDPPIVKAAQES